MMVLTSALYKHCVLSVFQVRGFSNNFWGWGREDDEFYRRVQEAGLTVSLFYVV